MTTLDLRKELKRYYAPSVKKAELIDIPTFQFATVDGAIEPGMGPSNSPAFKEALQALYGISYTLKFMSKLRKEDPIDYPVMALEALWWIESGEFKLDRPDNWLWRAMILQPDHITPAMFAEGVEQVRKKRGDSPSLNMLRLEPFTEGLCVQMMHIGPYADEPATIAKMDAFLAEQGYCQRAMHHEIYLSDPIRTAPAKLKTIVRHAVEKIAG